MTLLETISQNLNVPQNMLEEALFRSRSFVKHVKIPKRDGTIRLAYQPSNKLKVIQYWLINNIFKHLKVHSSATAYQKKTSIKINAEIHSKNRYFLKLDFKNFFPSINFEDFIPYIQSWNNNTKIGFDEEDLLEIIRCSCFYYKKDLLPIGFPTSPIISNIVMFDFDTKITALLANKDNYGIVAYTRYADDLIFSTNKKDVCKKIKTLVTTELREMKSPKLRLNPAKTKYVSSSGGSALVTGLRICHDHHITIQREYKNKIRLLIFQYKNGKLSGQEIMSLKGHLSYIRDVDSSFYTKIQNKHFSLLATLQSE